jgi:transcriptional regulator with XRE-family HTH domain
VNTVVKYPEVRDAYRNAREATDPRISQETLAEAVGITRRHMIRIENGEHRPNPELRDRIAAALDVDPSALPAVEQPERFQNGKV